MLLSIAASLTIIAGYNRAAWCALVCYQVTTSSDPPIPQQYASQLATVREDALREASAQIALVGCGDWKLIENYKSKFRSPRLISSSDTHLLWSTTTGDCEFKGLIYANPDRKLYDALGMVSNLQTTPKGETKRSYLRRSLLMTTFWSIWVRDPLFAWPLHL